MNDQKIVWEVNDTGISYLMVIRNAKQIVRDIIYGNLGQI